MAKCYSHTAGNDAIVIHPCGPLDHDSSEEILKNIETCAADDTTKIVVLDLSEATGSTSKALCPLVAALNVTKKRNLRFAVAHLPESLRKAFTITRLNTVIVDSATIDEAIRDAT